jgi:hypothetical protein
MPEDREFQQRIQGIEGLVHRLEGIPDKSTWAAIQELIESVMQLHGVALDRILTILAEHEGQDMRLAEALGNDELVGSVLLLHDLHPVDFDARVRRALEKSESILRGYGARAELLGTRDRHVQIELRNVNSAHIAKSSKATIEEAIYQAAPDTASLDILGLDQFGAANFVPLDRLQTAAAAVNGDGSPHSRKGGVSSL